MCYYIKRPVLFSESLSGIETIEVPGLKNPYQPVGVFCPISPESADYNRSNDEKRQVRGRLSGWIALADPKLFKESR
jgi:hypothetical protein